MLRAFQPRSFSPFEGAPYLSTTSTTINNWEGRNPMWQGRPRPCCKAEAALPHLVCGLEMLLFVVEVVFHSSSQGRMTMEGALPQMLQRDGRDAIHCVRSANYPTSQLSNYFFFHTA
jgi:hypothetical protein